MRQNRKLKDINLSAMKYHILIGTLISFWACHNSTEPVKVESTEVVNISTETVGISDEGVKAELVDKPEPHKFLNDDENFRFLMSQIDEFPTRFKNGDTIEASDITILSMKNDSFLISEEAKIMAPEGWDMTFWKRKDSLGGRKLVLYLLGANPKDTIMGRFKQKTLETNNSFKIVNGYKLLSTYMDNSQNPESYDHMYKINLIDTNDMSKSIYHADKEKCGTQKPVIYWEGDLNSDSNLDYILYMDGEFCKVYVLLLSDIEKGYTVHNYSHWSD